MPAQHRVDLVGASGTGLQEPAKRQASPSRSKAYDREGGGRFGKQDFRYVAAEDVYICPAGQKPAYLFTTVDKDLVYVATEPTPVRVALSRIAAPLARSD